MLPHKVVPIDDDEQQQVHDAFERVFERQTDRGAERALPVGLVCVRVLYRVPMIPNDP